MSYAIRPARPSERRALEDLQRRASLQAAGSEDYRDDLLAHPDAIELPAEQIAAGLVIVAEHWGAPVGFAVVLPRQDGHAELDGLFVEPDLWRGGIGRLLVEEAAQFAAALDAPSLMVTANPHATGFYAKCGFRECGSAETRFGPAPVMARSLVF